MLILIYFCENSPRIIDRLKAADNIIAFQCSITHHIAVIRLFRIISIPSKVFLFSSARTHGFDEMLGTGLPVLMYTTITPIDMWRISVPQLKMVPGI
jgi:hypothetical protein